jgi:hypothetical protein
MTLVYHQLIGGRNGARVAGLPPGIESMDPVALQELMKAMSSMGGADGAPGEFSLAGKAHPTLPCVVILRFVPSIYLIPNLCGVFLSHLILCCDYTDRRRGWHCRWFAAGDAADIAAGNAIARTLCENTNR